MKSPSPLARSVWLFLAAGCAAGRVATPTPPPPLEPSASSARATEYPAEPARAPVPARTSEGSTPAVAATPAAVPDEEPPEPEPGRPPTRPDPPLGWIAGEPLEPEELLLEWGDASAREMWLVLDKLVAARLALAEASRLGIRLEPEAVEQRFQTDREKLAQEIQRGKSKSKAKTLEEFIERELGFEPARYLERVRAATIRHMLAERAVRAASLAGESVAVRLVVVANEEGAAKVREALAAGRDFAEVASELSVDDSKREGGLVPFVVPQERSPLARLAFQTPPGETAGPLPLGDHQFWIRVEERRRPLEGDWATVGSPVEASLARFPVGDAEFVNWKLSMEARYPIDLGPLWSLIGAAK